MEPAAPLYTPIPFHFWSVVYFMFGTIVGSFLNVCIHRMPRGESVVSPPSHCPHCQYRIPGYLNIPLVTWLVLRGRCANCGAGIAFRYFAVELVTGLLFLGSWLTFGHVSHGLAATHCLLLAGLMVATFIDFEHFIIPDEITLGGIVAGVLCSCAVPALQGVDSPGAAMKLSFLGAIVGAGLIYLILELGKLALGRQRVELPQSARLFFTETSLRLPDREIPYEDLFFRRSDNIVVEASRVYMADRSYRNVTLRLSPERLRIDEETFEPESIPYLEVVCDRVVLPREAMGMGDVKFMAAIGAFLGWQAVVFSLTISSFLGALVGMVLIATRGRESTRIPYGPYIAAAAAIWIFGGRDWIAHWLAR